MDLLAWDVLSVNPARAGVILTVNPLVIMRTRKPRASGGDPYDPRPSMASGR